VIVADANAVAALVLPGEESELVDQLQRADSTWVAPPLILSELRSVIAKLVRTRRRTPAQGLALLDLAVEALDAVTFEPDPLRVFELVASSGCSSYDCEYVAVAEELGCPLATFDREVLRAFPAIAVHPLELSARREASGRSISG
jgi:predicted nucleic acid-binding protein